LFEGHESALARANNFAASYVLGSGNLITSKKYQFWKRLNHTNSLKEDAHVWAAANLNVHKIGNMFAVTVKKKHGLHDHDRLKFVGIKSLLSTRWYEVSPRCDKADVTPVYISSEVAHYGFWAELAKHSQRGFSNDYFRTESVVTSTEAGLEGFVGEVKKGSDPDYRVRAEGMRRLSQLLPEGMGWANVHNYVYHPDVFTENTELEGVPMVYVKQMFNLPDDAQLLASIKREQLVAS
jgi:hypothetical protein